MKKKFLFIILLILLITISLSLFSKKIGRIKIKKDISKAINENNNVTIIDVTDISIGEDVGHQHIYESKYNKQQHWKECKICGDKQNNMNHVYTTTWILGYESCRYDNGYTNICECGYTETGHKPCVWDGSSYMQVANYRHARFCSNCNSYIAYSYYLGYFGNGTIHSTEFDNLGLGSYVQFCQSSYGVKMDCSNANKTCYLCKKYNSENSHILTNSNDYNKISCENCNIVIGEITRTIESNSSIPKTYTIIEDYSLSNGATFNSVGQLRNDSNCFSNNGQVLNSIDSSKTNFRVTSTAVFRDNWKYKYFTWTTIYLNLNGRKYGAIGTNGITISPDDVSPTISSITQGDSIELTEWTKKKEIVISGTENYCHNVNIKIIDDGGITIFDGGAVVNNNQYSISCTPEIECDAEGRMFKVIVTDSCDNSIEQVFKIAKVDSIPPEPVSEDSLSDEWAKEKLFTFSCIDTGIGEVEIAFNDKESYGKAIADGKNFSREYKFVGDVYKDKQAIVLYKDGLGNILSKEVTLKKLDNTAPTIINSSIHNNVITIDSHDRHERLGEGSGVVKYRYITSNQKIENPIISNENSVEVNVDEKMIIDKIYEVKYVYVVAEDLVGNVSDVYEIKVPQLILTSSVDLSLANGKGGVILDWSTYDISDKYFVIYRKEENSDNWNAIVGLDKKLNASNFIDVLANDKKKTSVPSINIDGIIEDNSIKINASSNDSGSKYEYYIEAYSSTNLELLAVSD